MIVKRGPIATVEERIAIPAVVRIEQLRPAVLASSNIRLDKHGSSRYVRAGLDAKARVADRLLGNLGHVSDPSQRRWLFREFRQELV